MAKRHPGTQDNTPCKRRVSELRAELRNPQGVEFRVDWWRICSTACAIAAHQNRSRAVEVTLETGFELSWERPFEGARGFGFPAGENDLPTTAHLNHMLVNAHRDRGGLATPSKFRAFFVRLAERPGYKSRIGFADAEYFTPTAAHARIADARRESRVPTVEQFEAVVAKTPSETVVHCRDRAIVAFLLLSGARDGSIPTFKLKHVDLAAGTVFHDAREVKTKGAKTFPAVLFPVGDVFLEFFAGYVARLQAELLLGPDDPLFPAPQMGHDAERGFAVPGLSRKHWRNASPIRRIVRSAFEAAGFG